jgi:hypothetical protein
VPTLGVAAMTSLGERPTARGVTSAVLSAPAGGHREDVDERRCIALTSYN